MAQALQHRDGREGIRRDPAALLISDQRCTRFLVEPAVDGSAIKSVRGQALLQLDALGAGQHLLAARPIAIERAATPNTIGKMADRKQITGALLDGPLAFDNAIDMEAARIKGIKSEVAGRAQILLVPDLESGNMLAKNLSYFAKADGAGIVLGARVPVVLTSRADTARSRMASAAVAALHADARRRKAPIASA